MTKPTHKMEVEYDHEDPAGSGGLLMVLMCLVRRTEMGSVTVTPAELQAAKGQFQFYQEDDGSLTVTSAPGEDCESH